MNEIKGNNLAPKTVRESLSTELRDLGKSVVALSSQTRDRIACQLTPVIREQTEGKGEQAAPVPLWPPLLAELRTLFMDIQDNLKDVNETLDRLEI